MRDIIYETVTSNDPQELMSTGEAAKLLNTSRQHVVNLCDRGELPFVTTGSHRRIKRLDLEAIQTRTDKLTRDQRKSLWMAYAIAGAICQDPVTAISKARKNLLTMRKASRGQAKKWLDEWQNILDGPIENVLSALVSKAPMNRELRQNQPFSGVLEKQDRDRLLAGWEAAQRMNE